MITEELFFSEILKLGSAMGQTFKKESQIIWFQDVMEYKITDDQFKQAMKNIRCASQYVSGNLANLIIAETRSLPVPTFPLLVEPTDKKLARTEMEKFERMARSLDMKCKLT